MQDDDQRAVSARLDEAEHVLDSLMERVRSYTSRAVAIAREEAEDMVAEARELKQRDSS